MKKIVAIAFGFSLAFSLYCQEISESAKRVLFVYEESNKSTDPWRDLFQEELSGRNYGLEVKTAAEAGSLDLSAYDLIIIHGAVMAFASKEPVRDWLKGGGDVSGKKVGLFVTTSRWCLKKYTDQLLALLKKGDATVVDSVSGATKDLTDQEKRNLVHGFIENIE